MKNILSKTKTLFTHGAEGIAAFMLATMFLAFLLQVFARYVLKDPYTWTPELCLALWVWIVFFGSGFILKNNHQVTFDIFFLLAPRPLQRIMVLTAAVIIVIGFGISFLPSYEYIQWLKIKKSATLKIPMRSLFSVYIFFIFSVILRYIWQIGYTLSHPELETRIPGFADQTHSTGDGNGSGEVNGDSQWK